MPRYVSRILESKVINSLDYFPVIGVTGPRQSGKSTMLKRLFQNQYQYVTFDNDNIRTMFYDDPNGFMQIYNDRVIFDEAQKVPEIFNSIKVAVDADRDNYGKYIITGSAQFSLLKQITETLAGRINLLTLLPFQFTEMPTQSQNQSIYAGCYPETVMHNYVQVYDWYSSYISTYMERDVRGLYDIGNLKDFRRFLGLLAANTSQILNLSRYANDLGVAVSTIKRWLSVLEASYIVFLLPPYYKNFGKRIVKSPKIYFYDTGLVSHLTGISTEQLFSQGPMAGAIFENYIISEIIKRETHIKSSAEFYYYRTTKGQEIDLIIDRKISQDFIEIKYNATFHPRMVKQITKFMTKDHRGYLLYTGKSLPYHSNIKILNYKDYLSETQ